MKSILVIILFCIPIVSKSQDFSDINYIKKCSGIKLYTIDFNKKILNAILPENFVLQGLYFTSESEHSALYSFLKSNPTRDLFSPPKNLSMDIKYIKNDIAYLLKVLKMDSKSSTEILNALDLSKIKFDKSNDGFLINVNSSEYEEFNVAIKHVGYKTDLYSFWFRRLM